MPSGAEPATPLSFPGYVRANGSVGVRNFTLVLPTSERLNRIAELVDDPPVTFSSLQGHRSV